MYLWELWDQDKQAHVEPSSAVPTLTAVPLCDFPCRAGARQVSSLECRELLIEQSTASRAGGLSEFQNPATMFYILILTSAPVCESTQVGSFSMSEM